jgi:hypothetical protein
MPLDRVVVQKVVRQIECVEFELIRVSLLNNNPYLIVLNDEAFRTQSRVWHGEMREIV